MVRDRDPELPVNPDQERATEGRWRPARVEMSPPDATSALDAFDAGVLLCGPDWKIRVVNGVAERVLDRDRGWLIGRSLWEAIPSLHGTELEAACRRTMEFREMRQVHDCALATGRAGARAQHVDVRTRPASGGGVLLLLEDAADRHALEGPLGAHEEGERGESLRVLARQLAAVSDSAELLALLARAAQHQAAARGAAVVQVNGEQGDVVATSGQPIARRGSQYLLTGSMVEAVVRRQTLVVEEHYSEKYAETQARTGGPPVGPAIGVPLIAHEQVLGVLAVSRSPQEAPFSAHEVERLRVIADYASLVLWKALLLEQAQAANTAKATFLSTISHELRTPLTALTGYGELLHDQMFGPLTKGQLDIVERMRSVTQQLAVMIEEILAFSSLEVGREIVRARPMDLVAAARSALGAVEQLARVRGLAIETAIPDEVPTIESDADKVRQILVNLLGNAVKFTERGTVRLAITVGEEEIAFAVTDTGIGIAPENRARLFLPFSQLDTSLTRRHGGTGLGLYISHRLASMLGGRLEMESSPGRGSTFTLLLPRTLRGQP